MFVRVRNLLLKLGTCFKSQDESSPLDRRDLVAYNQNDPLKITGRGRERGGKLKNGVEKAREVGNKLASQLRNIDTDHKRDYLISCLCDDILIDILCNLSTESILTCKLVCRRWYSLIMSKHFAEQHVKTAAKPITLAQFDSICFKPALFVIDDLGEPSKMKRVRTSQLSEPNNTTLEGSCDGILLLFSYRSRKYVLFNPLREKFVTLTLPSSRYILGIFFDKLNNNEYKILQFDMRGEYAHYSTYGLRTKHQKWLGATFKLRPMFLHHRVVTLPRSMCWKVYDIHSLNKNSSKSPLCPRIMVFEFDTEKLYAISDPEKCVSDVFNHYWDVQLLEWDGKLVFLQSCDEGHKRVDIWVLEDSENVLWVKRQVINVSEELFGHFGISTVLGKAEFLKIINDELLVICSSYKTETYYFWYNLRSRIVRRIQVVKPLRRYNWSSCDSTAFTYTPSFVLIEYNPL